MLVGLFDAELVMKTYFNIAILILMFSASGFSQSLYVGFGGSLVDMTSGYSAIPNVNHSAYSLCFGGGFFRTWRIDFSAAIVEKISTDTTENIFYPQDKAEFGLVSVSLRKDLVFDERTDHVFIPWVAVGYAIQNVMWEYYFYNVTSTGYSLSAGLDIKLMYGFNLDFFYQYQNVDGNDTYEYGPYHFSSDEIGMKFIYQFDFGE